MRKEILPDIEKQISDLLEEQGKDYLSVIQIRNNLPIGLLRHFNLMKTSSQTDVLRKLKPHLGDMLQNYTGYPNGKKTSYIGFKMSMEKIILRQVELNPGLSSRQLRNAVPATNKVIVNCINALIKEGRMTFTLREGDHRLSLRIPSPPKVRKKAAHMRNDPSERPDNAL